MAVFARLQLEEAAFSLFERDSDLAHQVIDRNTELANAELELEQQGVDTLETFQLSGEELRFVLSAMRISRNIKRIGDHAVKIAERSLQLMGLPDRRGANFIQPVYDRTISMLIEGMSAFADQDLVLARGLPVRAAELENLFTAALLKYSDLIETGNARRDDVMALISVLRSLERVGHLATSIGEDVTIGRA